MLVTKGLTKTFGRRVVVDNVDLEIKQGENPKAHQDIEKAIIFGWKPAF